MSYERYKCECGKSTNYGISYNPSENPRSYWIGSCCDNGSGVGCVVAEDIKFCPFCAKKLPLTDKDAICVEDDQDGN